MTLGAAFELVLSAARAGEGWAFRRLFEDLARPVAGYLRLQGAREPEDLTNETFLGAFSGIASFTGDEARFRSWVFTIAHRRLVDERRRAGRRPDTTAELDHELVPGGTDTEDEALASLGDERVGSREGPPATGPPRPQEADLGRGRTPVNWIGDDPDEMRGRALIDDHEVATLLDGGPVGSRPELQELGCFLEEVRSAAVGPLPRVGSRLEALLDHDLAHLPARAVTTSPPLASRARREPRPARRLLVRLAATAGGLTMAVTGAAAADLLPRAVQDGVAAVVEKVTPLDLPDSREAPDGPRRGAEPDRGQGEGGRGTSDGAPQVVGTRDADLHEVGSTDSDRGGAGGVEPGNVTHPEDADAKGSPPRGKGSGPADPRPPTTSGRGERGPAAPEHDRDPAASHPEAPSSDGNPGAGHRR